MDLKDLYRDVIVDHNRSPRNFRQIEPPRREAEGLNPLCGDKLHVYLRVSDDRIEDAAFEGSGCAISVASASMMTEFLNGKTETEALDLFERIHEMLTGNESDMGDLASLGKLAALSGVRQYPTRVKCASLCWHTMKSALSGGDTVSTE
ncbi:MAG: SUF system NifU family Fe-S cluster assembly protein [Gammaproteobacteria bacterium]|jgi:nitrogen fixation NifU-like protein|nr:MAG: SUF system NifU family Fe-S cluster assembly protein [Gammaproteobacteria bacterium]